MEFQIQRELKGETWANFTDDLESLEDKEYPELEQAAGDRIALKISLLQSDNPLVAFGVKQKNPETLDAAACITLELVLCVTSKSSTFPVLGIDVSSPKTVDNEVIGAVSNTNKLCGMIEEMRKELSELELMKQRSKDVQSRPSSRGEQDRI